jgi:hypothetical protein
MYQKKVRESKFLGVLRASSIIRSDVPDYVGGRWRLMWSGDAWAAP